MKKVTIILSFVVVCLFCSNLNASSHVADSIYEAGVRYYDSLKYGEAYHNFIQSRSLYREYGDRMYETDALFFIAEIFNKTYAYEASIECYKEVIKIKKEIGDYEMLARAARNLGLVYKNHKMYDSAIDVYVNLAIPLYSNINDKIGISKVNNDIGEVFFEVGRYRDAINYYFKALIFAEGTSYEIKRTMITYNNVGNAYFKLKEYKKALVYLKKSYKLKESNQRKSIKTTVYNLAKLFYEINDIDSTIFYLEKISTAPISDLRDYERYKLCKKIDEDNPGIIDWNYELGLTDFIDETLEMKEITKKWFNFYEVLRVQEKIQVNKQMNNYTYWLKSVIIAIFTLIAWIFYAHLKKKRARKILLNMK